MRRIYPIGLVVLFVIMFGTTFLFLYEKSRVEPAAYETELPFVTTIVKKAVATGLLVPRREVEIKPRVSGVVEKLFVEPGGQVEQGQRIALIKIIPNAVNLNQAEAAHRAARIRTRNAKRELARYRTLLARQLISGVEFAQKELEFQLRRQEARSAWNNLQLVRSGAARGVGNVSNVVTSTVQGMVLDVPVKEGTSVTETNNFSAGTTMAVIADMGNMIFQGRVDESDVGTIKVGLPLEIVVGAVRKRKVQGTLEYIAPKGVLVEGSIQFDIKAAIEPVMDVFIRAGYSANAHIVLDKRVDALAIHEGLLQFEKDGAPFVEVKAADDGFEKRPVEVGLSDGVQIEILRGVDSTTAIKKPAYVSRTPLDKGAG